MKTTSLSRRATGGFTLIELLTVISIIGILASLLIPAISKAKEKAKIAQCRTEVKGIESAISAYEAQYSRYPSTKQARASSTDDSPDFTYGTKYVRADGGSVQMQNKKGDLPAIVNPSYQESNAQLVGILQDLEVFRGGMAFQANKNHALNPGKTAFLKGAKEVTGGIGFNGLPKPGIGEDGVYRDPWSNPYIISIDINGDGKCRDAFYRRQAVSQNKGDSGINGLSRPPSTSTDGGPDRFESNNPIMVWSFGPDGTANANVPADKGVNKDNIVSW